MEAATELALVMIASFEPSSMELERDLA